MSIKHWNVYLFFTYIGDTKWVLDVFREQLTWLSHHYTFTFSHYLTSSSCINTLIYLLHVVWQYLYVTFLCWQVPLEEGLNKTIQYFSRELEHQANNQYIPKPKAARMKKGRPRHNWSLVSRHRLSWNTEGWSDSSEDPQKTSSLWNTVLSEKLWELVSFLRRRDNFLLKVS